MKEIKAVIFDVNGVLALGVELRKGSRFAMGFHEEMAKVLDLELDTWLDAIDSAYAYSMEGKISKIKILKIISGNLNIYAGKLEKKIIESYRKLYRRNDELYDFAFNLRKKGYKIAILSDQWHLSKNVFIDKKDAKKFDAVVVSCDVGMRKPNPKIYKYTLKKLKLKAHETVFIDNRKWNTKAAKKSGIKSILFKSNKQAFRELKKLGISA